MTNSRNKAGSSRQPFLSPSPSHRSHLYPLLCTLFSPSFPSATHDHREQTQADAAEPSLRSLADGIFLGVGRLQGLAGRRRGSSFQKAQAHPRRLPLFKEGGLAACRSQGSDSPANLRSRNRAGHRSRHHHHHHRLGFLPLLHCLKISS